MGSQQPPRTDLVEEEPEPITCETPESIVMASVVDISWTCSDGNTYSVECSGYNVEGYIVSNCDCLENGEVTDSFGLVDVHTQSWDEVVSSINAECGWSMD